MALETRPDQTVREVDTLLRGEIAATETYVQALAKFEKEGRPAPAELRRIRDEHVDAANVLRRFVAAKDEKPSQGSGAWGAFAKAVEGTAKVFGNRAALKALKEGEEHGVGEYEEVLAEEDLDVGIRKLIGERLLPRQRQHVLALDALLAALPRS